MDEVGFVHARSDNLPKVDSFMLVELAATSRNYTSAQIRNIKTDRAMRENYTESGIGRVRLKRDGKFCTVKAEVCPEHRQQTKNYDVLMVVDEDEELITELQCLDCAASAVGCKHALVFLMWMNEKSSRPAPTDVENYWSKPKFSGVSANAVLQTKDFGEVEQPGISTQIVEAFFAEVLSPPQPTISTFQRYNSDIEPVISMDLHQLFLRYVNSTDEESASASDFRNFCSPLMSETLCEAAREASIGQSESRYWHFLRYGRISGSTIHTAANSKKETGGLLKEMILGVSILHLSRTMQRGLALKNQVIDIVKKQLKINVRKIGIQLSAKYPEFGASPDALSDEYVIEVKCPLNHKTFKHYIQDGDIVGPKFMAQMQLQMKMCRKSKAIFCVTHPDFEKSKEVKILFVDFDKKLTDDLIRKARVYWDTHIFSSLLSTASS